MVNIIQEELNLAKSKMIEEVIFRDKKLAKLTRDNVAIAEAMMSYDPVYKLSIDAKAGPIKNDKGEIKFNGSRAYWMTKLKEYFVDPKNPNNCKFEEIIKWAVEAVDRENSTHLNADGCGRNEITQRIINFEKELYQNLEDPEKYDFKLVNEIAKKTITGNRSRTNLSFASKFCHYACFYIFEGTDKQDNYPIYDSILKKVLPYYLDFFKNEEKYNFDCYKVYYDAIDKLIDKLKEETGIDISRNGLDHLLWFYHRSLR